MAHDKYWGYHLMLDCAKCSKKLIKDEKHIRNFIDALVIDIDMEKLGDLKIENLQTGPKNYMGISVVQLVHTSSIVVHFVESTGDVYLDIFSCKQFNRDDAIACFDKYFKPTKMNVHYLTRDANIVK